MNPVEKTIWYIESHLGDDLSLNNMADVAGVTPWHLTRAFCALIDMPPMRYARTRRLSLAARALSEGREGILQIALAAGYGSHEAFTRAFAAHFGATPRQVRQAGDLTTLNLVEPVMMNTIPPIIFFAPNGPRSSRTARIRCDNVSSKANRGAPVLDRALGQAVRGSVQRQPPMSVGP